MYKLRELKREDLEIINSWRNNPELISFLGAPFRFINIEVDELWFDNYMRNRSNTVRCSIADAEDRIIGLVSLTSIDYIQQTAQFHIMIGDSVDCNKGIGSFAIREMLNHAFFNLNLHRIELGVLCNNARAQRAYEKAGFIKEGVKRKAVYKNGEFVDLWIYGVLKEEYNCQS